MINYAHRGASAYYPENTMRAFYAALDMGADGIETDIQRSWDGTLVLFHDDTLERITGSKYKISGHTYEQLKKMDFGSFKGEEFKGEPIVRLDTFLHFFGRRGLHLALELKQKNIEAQVLDLLAGEGFKENITITSFIWESVRACASMDPSIPTGFLTERITPEVLENINKAGITQICPRVDLTSEEDMKLAEAAGVRVRFWGVKNEELMRRAVSLGGIGMTVNFPDKLSKLLKEI